MYIGTQFGCRHDTDIEVLAQLGVMHVDQTPSEPWEDWTADTLKAMRERFARHGIDLEMIHLPLGSRSAFVNAAGAIFLGPSDERDRQIERVCETVRMAAEAGCAASTTTSRCSGTCARSRATVVAAPSCRRSNSTSWTVRSASSRAAQPMRTRCGSASTTGLRTSCRWPRSTRSRWPATPSDPGIGYGVEYRGVARVLGMVNGFKKLIELYDSPCNGLNFCIGCMAESLENPRADIYDVIRYFGERGKLFNIHFRNIKGGLGDFVEVFPDEGDVDMLKALRILKEVGYRYMIMPDHVPGISGAEPQQVGFAYTYGYIHALLQAVNEE